jgi:hypothetical protein
MCFLLASTYAELNSFSLQFSNYGAISVFGHFTVRGVNGVYAGTENISPYRTTSGSDAVKVISTVFGWMSSGQGVELIGTFTLVGDLELTKSITMNWTQATITFAGPSGLQWTIRAKVTMLGGHTVDIANPANDYNPPNGGHMIGGAENGGVNEARILLVSGASNSVFDGIDFKNYGVFFAYYHTTSNITFKNCIFHDFPDTGSSVPIIGGDGGGYHTVQDCRFLHSGHQAIFLTGTNKYNKFLRSEFGDFAGVGSALVQHTFYLSGGGIDSNTGLPNPTGGFNEIAYCIFHDMADYGGAIQIKCPSNKIHDCTFYNYTDTVAFSIYSQWVGTVANDNEIYNNTFTDMDTALWIGKNDAVSPTLRTLIHDNTFTRVDYCVHLLLSGASSIADDTKIYYNNFHNCGNPVYSQASSLVHNTVFTYNYLDTNTSAAQLRSTVNSMCYQNTFYPPSTSLAMPNFNYDLVTDPNSYYYVAPRS